MQLIDDSVVTLGINAILKTDGEYLYVPEYGNGSLAIYALSNPRTPRFVSRLALPGVVNPRTIALQMPYVLVGGTGAEIDTVDVSNKSTTSPSVVWTSSPEPGAISIAVDGTDLFVVVGDSVPSGLVRYDATNAGSPVRLEVGIVPVSTGTAGFAAVTPNYLYVVGHTAPLTLDTVAR